MNDEDQRYWKKEDKDAVAYSIIRQFSDIREIAKQAEEAFTRDLTPEEVLAAKSEFLIRIIGSFPISIDSCPFCVIQHAKYDDSEDMNDPCDGCTYAKANGDCSTSGSSYNTLVNALRDLRTALRKYPLQV